MESVDGGTIQEKVSIGFYSDMLYRLGDGSEGKQDWGDGNISAYTK
jgi:hypothetical protein